MNDKPTPPIDFSLTIASTWTNPPVTCFGAPVQQCRFDLLLWEYFFVAFHDRFKHIIELGTSAGGFSNYLLLQCINYNLRFDTYDIKKKLPNTSRLAKLTGLEKHFHVTDLQNPKAVSLIMQTAAHPALIYCDNGNKPKELKLYAAVARPGDWFAVHDWDTEIFARHVPASLDYQPDLLPIEEANKSMTRFFIQKEKPHEPAK